MAASSKPRVPPASPPASRWRELAPIAALGVLIAAAYANALTSPLLRDAQPIISGDPRVQELSWHNLSLIFAKGYWWPSSPLPLYRPFTTLTYLLNWTVLGNQGRPLGYHVVNLLLHWVNAALLYVVLLRIGRPGEFLRRAAFVAAALFAVHPIQTEAVTYIVGRADELVAFAVLAGLLAHQRAAESIGSQRARWLVLLAVMAFVGAFSKESGLLLVAVLVLHDALTAWPPRRFLGYLATLPAIAVFLVLRHLALLEDAWFPGWYVVDNPIVGLHGVAAPLTAMKVFALELKLLFFPGTLSCDYSYNAIAPFGSGAGPVEDALALLGTVLALVLIVRAVGVRQRAPAFAFGALFFLGTLLPTANLLFPTGSIMAERFLYVPSLGFCMLLASMLVGLMERWASVLTRLVLPAFAVVALGVRTHFRNSDWSDDLTLWQATVAAVPTSFRAQGSLARALFAQGPSDENLAAAIEHARLGIRILEANQLPPEDLNDTLYADLAHYLRLQGESLRSHHDDAEGDRRLEEAWEVAQRGELVSAAAVRKVEASGHPGRPMGSPNLDLEIFSIGADLQRWPEARVAIERAEKLAPLDAGVHMGIARLRLSEGALDDAAVALVKALIVDGRNGGAWSELQKIYGALGADGAIQIRGGRPGFDPSVAQVRSDTNRAANELIASLVAMGSLESARVLYRRAIDPSDLGCPPDAVAAPP